VNTYLVMKKSFILASLFIFGLSSCSSNNNSSKNLSNGSSETTSKKEDVYPYQMLKSFENHPFFSYNVENLFDTIDDPKTIDEAFLPDSKKEWTAVRYHDKLQKLSTVLTSQNENNPLFFGLVEVENRFVVLDLVQTGKLASTKYRIVHHESPDARGIDVAFAYDLERFKVMYEEAIPLTIAAEPNYKTRDILYVKGLLKDSIPIHIFVNHWSSRRGGQEKSEYKRMHAAKVLKTKTDSIRKADDAPNILIMGDFNDYPNNLSIQKFLGTGQQENSAHLVNLMDEMNAAGIGTYNYRGDWGTLDQFIVSPALLNQKQIRIKDGKAHIADDDEFMHFLKNGGKTPNKTYGGPNYFGGYSDHLSIYGYLELLNE